MIQQLRVKNYRQLADIVLELKDVSVFFGANGAGKSTIIDAICFFRDCVLRDVPLATALREAGFGVRWDGAKDGDMISITLSSDRCQYDLFFLVTRGQIESIPGEFLISKEPMNCLIKRGVTSKAAEILDRVQNGNEILQLREPQKPSLELFLDLNRKWPAASEMYATIKGVRSFSSRMFPIQQLKSRGSESEPGTSLDEMAYNALSVLRNLHDRKSIDQRFDTIEGFMKRAFPTFEGLLLQQTGPRTVYASVLEKGRKAPIRLFGVSDGQIQLLLLLTALFCEELNEPHLLMFDEPETSLHPWALAVFADAVQHAATKFGRQVLIVTHSPVLLSQFSTEQLIVADVEDGRTRLRRLGGMDDVKELLEEYSAGSLYMSQAIAPQSDGVPVGAK